MAVEVKLFANFREGVGQGEISIPAKSVKELIENISQEYENLEDELYRNKETGELNEFINILVNGRRIDVRNDYSMKLEDDDTVAIFPPVSGG